MKWEPVLVMLALVAIGLWVTYAPATPHALRPGAETTKFTLGASKGELEIVGDTAGSRSFRFLPKSGRATEPMSEAEVRRFLGDDIVDQAVTSSGNKLFRALNITSWGSFVWLSIGFVGQVLFAGRMIVQWIVSEKRKQSHIPESFWWFSLIGGAMLLVYFAWRQDPIGVLGQTPNVVIYVRNIRLIRKQRRRDAKLAAPSTEERS